MIVNILPTKLRGEVAAVSSKSYAHRLLIAAAQSDGPCTLHLNALSQDILATANCLRAMGAGVEIADGAIAVTPAFCGDMPDLDCHESGSTARFLLPVAAAWFDGFSMKGSGRLPERPLTPLLSEMQRHGCAFSGEHLPLSARGRLTSGEFFLPGGISSQFVSGLLLALPRLAGDSRIVLTSPLESEPYVAMTLQSLGRFGVDIQRTGDGYFVKGGQTFRSPKEIDVPGDWSNAAFFCALNAVGCDIRVIGLDPHDAQGDKEIVDILKSLPCESIDASQQPDLVPAIAAAAALTPGKTVITGAARLKMKESDRLQTTRDMLRALGADIRLKADGLEIHGKEFLTGGQVDAANDHRIAMAAAVAAAGCKGPVTIHGGQAVNKSYPAFWDDYRALGGQMHVIDAGE